MTRLLTRLAAIAGIAALYRWMKKERERARRARQPIAAVDPAEALRAKLDEARAAGDERDQVEGGETRVDEAPDPDVGARRQSVHERGRAAIDEMSSE
jgi:hypothetical protein